MTFDEQFRAALDNLTTRLNRDVARHLDSAVEELAAKAEELAAAAQADRQEAMNLAASEARLEVEKIAAERLAVVESERQQAIEQAVREARIEAERVASDRLSVLGNERQQAVEQAAREARVEAEKIAAERLAVFESERQQAIEQASREARVEAEKIAAERLAAVESERRQAIEQASREARIEAERVASDRLSVLGNERQQAVEQASREARAEAERAAAARLTATLADAEARARTSFQTADIEAGERLVRAFRAIDAGQSLSDVLNALVTAASREVARVALFLTKNAQFRSFRLVGFEPHFASGDEFNISTGEAAMLADAVLSRASVAAGDGAPFAPPVFAQLPKERGAVAVPLVINDEVAAVLYADQGAEGESNRESWPAIIEVLGRHGSRALEALTAQRLAKSLTDRSGASPRSVAPRPSAAQLPMATDTSTPRGDEHTAAWRYARLLVSEVRQHYESEVITGIRNRDLMSRLGSEIARAWALYEAEGTGIGSVQATNYFHTEMVKTLADGDASLLAPKR